MRTRTPRRGFTLLEVIVALVMLSVIVLGLASTTVAFTHEVSTDNVRVRAGSIADARIATVRSWPDYFTLSDFGGTVTDVPAAGWLQQTTVTRTLAGPNDYTRVTVRVTAPGLTSPVTRSLTLAAP